MPLPTGGEIAGLRRYPRGLPLGVPPVRGGSSTGLHLPGAAPRKIAGRNRYRVKRVVAAILSHTPLDTPNALVGFAALILSVAHEVGGSRFSGSHLRLGVSG